MSITVGSSTITVNSGASMADPPGTAGLFFARAWVNFNGTGTVAIRASGGVSSISDNGTGNYSVNFSASMTDANYCVVSGVGDTGAGAGRQGQFPYGAISPSTSSFSCLTGDAILSAVEDAVSVSLTIFR